MIRLSPVAALLIALSIVTTPMLMWAGAAQESTPTGESAPQVQFSIRPAGDTEARYFDNVEVHPGESITLGVDVINWAKDPVELRVYSTIATNGDNGGFVAGKLDDELFAPATWIDLETQILTLEPSETITLPFTVTAPEDAEPGQYTSALIAETADTFAIPGSETFSQRVRYAMQVRVIVPGEARHSFELGEPILDSQWLRIPIENTGNYLVRPEGSLQVSNSQGQVILESPVELNAVYAGLTTDVAFHMPAQLPDDDYVINLSLEDPESGATASLDEIAITVVGPDGLPEFAIISASIEPNAEEVVFANVDIIVENRSRQVDSTTVILEVHRDGELVEEFPLASNQIFLRGENTYTARYLPETEWESGTYTFRVVVRAVDPNGGQQMHLLTEDLDMELIVP